MASLNFTTGLFSGGLAGESFDICSGYGLSFSSASSDAAFSNANTITLTAGTWPTWIREVGKVFTISGSTLNNGSFTTVSIDVTNKILTVLEATVTESAQTIVADGSADSLLISNLLKAGNGVLTTDAPLVLYSTGSLGGARTLDISALEAESVAQGGEPLNGRFFYLSVQNSDISNSNKITVSSSATINGAANFEIKKPGDFLFFHETSGAWRTNILTRPGEAHATIAMIPFVAADWSAGTINEITVLQTGSPAAGQVGPHNLKVYPHYLVQVCDESVTPHELVTVETQFDSSGNITLVKAQKAKPFSGTVLIIGSLD